MLGICFYALTNADKLENCLKSYESILSCSTQFKWKEIKQIIFCSNEIEID